MCLPSYHTEYTGSRLIAEVKQCRSCSVLGGVTAWEGFLLLPVHDLFFFFLAFQAHFTSFFYLWKTFRIFLSDILFLSNDAVVFSDLKKVNFSHIWQ